MSLYSLVFLVCWEGGACQFIADQRTFPSKEICVTQAENTLIEVEQRVARGEMNPHVAIYECFNWGVAS